MVSRVLLALLDPWLFRHPFEGTSAARYARAERPAFGDLDERLCDHAHADLSHARTLLDIGAGPGTFVATAVSRFPSLSAIAVEPSRDFVRMLSRGPATALRARAESLPLDDASIDVAVSISSIRHVSDRLAALTELRRVVRPGGAAWILELDPSADRRRIRAHAEHLASPFLRATFAPLVLRTAPPAAAIARLARTAGWSSITLDDDPIQPLYRLRLA
jgi:ubiquinone/menaquinone biosynthesis C-methylase UbiE